MIIGNFRATEVYPLLSRQIFEIFFFLEGWLPFRLKSEDKENPRIRRTAKPQIVRHTMPVVHLVQSTIQNKLDMF